MKKFIAVILISLVMLVGCTDKSNQEVSYTDQGMSAIENKNYDEALTDFETAASQGEDEQLVFRGKGIAYIGKGEYETAIENLKFALKKSSGKVTDLEIDSSYYLALAQYKNSDREGAIKTYTNILSFDDKDAKGYYLRGTVYLADGDLTNATSDFDQAISCNPSDYDIYINIFNNLNNKGYTAEGQAYLNNALKIENTKDNGLNKGMIYYYLGDTDNALAQLTKAKDAGDNKALLYIGKVYQLLEDNDNAVSFYEEYITNSVNTEGLGVVYNIIGLCKMEAGSYEDALSDFSTGIALNESDSIQELLFNEVVAYENLSDFTTAAQKMEEYINLYPDDSIATREYEFLKTR
ncbi:MAG: tetratricopeptide repeat protein [Lachnotalea sp.]